MFFNKETFINTFNENIYQFFNFHDLLFKYLIDAEPMLNQKSFLTKSQINSLLLSKSTKYHKFNEFFAVRKSGKMFTYSNNIVPIAIYTLYQPASLVKLSKFKKELKPGYLVFRFHAYTIDDSSMDFSININSLEELNNFYKYSFEFLNIYTYMPSSEEFELFWKKYGVIDFDYN
jgi:hypothetical protein